MDDIRGRLRDIEKTDRHCKAGKSIAYRPHGDDDPDLIDALVRCLVDTDAPDHLSDMVSAQSEVRRMTSHILEETTCDAVSTNIGGLHIRMTRREIIFSVPTANDILVSEDILRKAESEIMDRYEV